MLKRSALKIALVVALAGLTSACFQPLHAPNGSFSAAGSPLLRQVHVKPIDGWMGHQLKSELDFLFKGGTPGIVPLYELRITTKETTSASLIDVSTGRAQSATLGGEAVYELVEMGTGKRLTGGKTYASATFTRSIQRFANVRAQRDAETRMAKTFAERLRGITAGALLSPERASKTLPRLSENDENTQAANPGDES